MNLAVINESDIFLLDTLQLYLKKINSFSMMINNLFYNNSNDNDQKNEFVLIKEILKILNELRDIQLPKLVSRINYTTINDIESYRQAKLFEIINKIKELELEIEALTLKITDFITKHDNTPYLSLEYIQDELSSESKLLTILETERRNQGVYVPLEGINKEMDQIIRNYLENEEYCSNFERLDKIITETFISYLKAGRIEEIINLEESYRFKDNFVKQKNRLIENFDVVIEDVINNYLNKDNYRSKKNHNNDDSQNKIKYLYYLLLSKKEEFKRLKEVLEKVNIQNSDELKNDLFKELLKDNFENIDLLIRSSIGNYNILDERQFKILEDLHKLVVTLVNLTETKFKLSNSYSNYIRFNFEQVKNFFPKRSSNYYLEDQELESIASGTEEYYGIPANDDNIAKLTSYANSIKAEIEKRNLLLKNLIEICRENKIFKILNDLSDNDLEYNNSSLKSFISINLFDKIQKNVIDFLISYHQLTNGLEIENEQQFNNLFQQFLTIYESLESNEYNRKEITPELSKIIYNLIRCRYKLINGYLNSEYEENNIGFLESYDPYKICSFDPEYRIDKISKKDLKKVNNLIKIINRENKILQKNKPKLAQIAELENQIWITIDGILKLLLDYKVDKFTVEKEIINLKKGVMIKSL